MQPSTSAPGPLDPIVDKFGRVFRYLRIAVTERCNLRCVYCMPEEGVAFANGEQLLDLAELTRVIGIFARLGVTKVRFTGGEPLVRKDIVDLVAAATATSEITEVHLTSNGVLLERFLEPLLDAGLSGINISLDSLDPDRFAQLTRRSGVEAVLGSIRRAVAVGIPSVKINVVAMRGFNDDEIPAFVELTRELPVTVRFIELMPFDAHQVWKRGRFLGAHKIVASLEQTLGARLHRVSGSSTEEHSFSVAGHAGRVAVIPAYTRSMCGSCDRIRLTADGQIRNCLYSEQEYDLRRALRAGADDEAIIELIRDAMKHKLVDGWAAQHTAPQRRRTSMTQIGG